MKMALASNWTLTNAAARKHLASNNSFAEPLQKELAAADTWLAFLAVLETQEVTEAITALTTLITAIQERGACYYAHNSILLPKVPKFFIL